METKKQIYKRLCDERKVPPEVRLEGQSYRELLDRLMKGEYDKGFSDGKKSLLKHNLILMKNQLKCEKENGK